MIWHLKGDPYKVQSVALSMAYGAEKYGYWLEQGLGKTAVVLNEFLDMVMRDKIDCMVVICPNYLKGNWKKETEEWAGPWIKEMSLEVTLWPELPTKTTSIFVLNYEAILAKGGDTLEQWMVDKQVLVVLDESHRIKNPKSKTFKRLFDMMKDVKYRRILTGTPMVQNVMDLWSQLRFIGQLNGKPSHAFRNTYAVTGGYMGKQVVGFKNEDKLQELLNSCTFRALKVDWADDLPDKLYKKVETKMVGKQQQAYRDMLADFLVEIKGEQVAAEQVVSQLLKLQQISSGFIYDSERKPIDLVESCPKMDVLHELISDVDGKVVVIGYFEHSIRKICNMLTDKGIKYAKLVRGAKIDDEKAAFNTDDDVKVLVGQLSVASTAHTKMGTEKNPCSTMIFFENSYALGDRMQVEDRIHRYGQKYPCLYIDLYASKMEEGVIKALQAKKDIVAAVVDSARAFQ